MTTREPLRDVVARSLGIGEVPAHRIPFEGARYYPTATPEEAIITVSEHVDRLYVAAEKLAAAAQLIIDELKVGKPDDAPSAKQSGETAR